MVKDRYRYEMERLGPRQEELDRLQAMMEGGAEMKRVKGLSVRAAAILACAILMATAAAAAAVPAVWETLRGHLGVFTPYAQTIQGAACSDQGVRLQVLSALSDDLEARVYLAVQDVEGDRLDQCLNLTGRLTAGLEREEGEASVISASDVGTGYFKLLSYDPNTKTALFSAGIFYGDQARPDRRARLAITGMNTREGSGHWSFSCASVSGDTLESLPLGEEDRTILSPSDVIGLGYTDAVLPKEGVVLAPEQNPMPIQGTEDIWVSSMGFAGDGCFHIRLGFGDGVSLEDEDLGSRLLCGLTLEGERDSSWSTCRETLVPGGMDILFPLFGPEDLELIQRGDVKLNGSYTRPGLQIEGSWTVEFPLEYHPSVTLEWTGELAGRQVRQVTLSPLSVTMLSNDPGGFHNTVLYALKKDGSTVAAEPDTGSYSNVGADGGPAVWNTFNTWKFQEPVNLEEVTALSLAGETLPVS